MELYKEILVHILQSQDVCVTFPDLPIDAEQLAEMVCYEALRRIKAVIEDDSLEDSGCFAKIEEIVCILEQIGSDGGSRHDFG